MIKFLQFLVVIVYSRKTMKTEHICFIVYVKKISLTSSNSRSFEPNAWAMFTFRFVLNLLDVGKGQSCQLLIVFGHLSSHSYTFKLIYFKLLYSSLVLIKTPWLNMLLICHCDCMHSLALQLARGICGWIIQSSRLLLIVHHYILSISQVWRWKKTQDMKLEYKLAIFMHLSIYLFYFIFI